MGFFKRYISEQGLRHEYNSGGYVAVEDYITYPDTLIIEDDFSFEVTDIIRDNNMCETSKKFNIFKLFTNFNKHK